MTYCLFVCFFPSAAFNFLIPLQKPLIVYKLGSTINLVPNAPPKTSTISLICFRISILKQIFISREKYTLCLCSMNLFTIILLTSNWKSKFLNSFSIGTLESNYMFASLKTLFELYKLSYWLFQYLLISFPQVSKSTLLSWVGREGKNSSSWKILYGSIAVIF